MTDQEDECIHGLGPVSACSVCSGRAAREAKEAAEQPRNFPAKWSGQCQECNLPIMVGDIIAYLPDHPITHQECWT